MSLSLPVITLLILNDILLFIFFRIDVFTAKLYIIIPEIIKQSILSSLLKYNDQLNSFQDTIIK